MENNIMRHSKEEIEQAFNNLLSKDSSEEYQKNILYIMEYIEDLVLMTETYKKSADNSIQLVTDIIKKIVSINMENNQTTMNSKQHKIAQLKKVKMINDIANNQIYNIIKKEKENE